MGRIFSHGYASPCTGAGTVKGGPASFLSNFKIYFGKATVYTLSPFLRRGQPVSRDIEQFS